MLAPLRAVLPGAPGVPGDAEGDHRALMPLDREAGRLITTPDHCRDLSDRPKLARVLLI